MDRTGRRNGVNDAIGAAGRGDRVLPMGFVCLVAIASACGGGGNTVSSDSADGSTETGSATSSGNGSATSSGNSSATSSGNSSATISGSAFSNGSSNTSSNGSGNTSGSAGSGSGSSSSSSVTPDYDGGLLTYYASPTGTGTACTSSAPCSILQAQTAVRAAVQAMRSDITVELADGVYTLAAPLIFTAADSPASGGTRPGGDAGAPSADAGENGHTIAWQAATGAHPVLSGATKVTGWTLIDSGKNIWKATAPSTFVTRQLYVDGKVATRARSGTTINRTDMNMVANGWSFTNSALSFLNTLKQPGRAEMDVLGSWTNRYSPIQSVSNGTVTMVQPAWDQNTWGYDPIKCAPNLGGMCQGPYRNGPIYVENDYTLLDQPGEWYQDTTAGVLYYIPVSGQSMSTADVELPQLQLLLAVGGTCPSGLTDGGGDCAAPTASNPTQAVAYAAPAGGDPYGQPAHDLSFIGLTFSYTSWLAPNSSNGFIDMQTGGFLVGPRSDYPGGGQSPAFEAARPHWHQMPAAVQVSNAYNISFIGDRFADFGEVGLGIGNDANAHETGVGLGADGIRVTGCVFSQISGGGIVVGGSQAWAHHPCGDKVCTSNDPGSRLINQNMIFNDNIVHDVGIDYRDSDGLMFTYTANVVVTHNDIYSVPYSGINSGFGWGTNDAGGNADYKTRGTGNLYLYQPWYLNPTVAMNNTISANYVHEGMLQMNDGGCHYNLGFQPGTVVTENYCEGAGSGLSGTFWGDYNDEGSAYITETKNVYADFGAYVTANSNTANNTGHITFTDNWGNSASPGLNGPGNTVTGNIAISGGGTGTAKGTNFPSAAQTIVKASGLEPAYAGLTP